MNLFINRAPIKGPWGGGANWVNAFYDNAKILGYTISSTEKAPDAIILLGLEGDNNNLQNNINLQNDINLQQALYYKQKLYSQYRHKLKVILRVNENDARKGTNHVDQKWLQAMNQVDGVVFVSNWLRDYYKNLGWNKNNDTVIVNGVDLTIFSPKEKLTNNKINIVTHHWSSNKLKGERTHLFLDSFVKHHHENYTYTYIGRSDVQLRNTNIISPLFGKALGDELGRYDVYITATHADPAPNHVIESISCGIPTYVKSDGGGAVELAGIDHVWNDHNELEQLLLSKQFTKNNVQFQSWKDSMKQFIEFVENI